MNIKKPTVISTFAGCGGSSLGYKLAGFKELLAIDFDKNAVETFKLNFPEMPIWQKDIKEIKSQEIFGFCKIKKGELDVLDGSPPCQGFSTAGKRQITDPRNNLFNHFVRLIEELQPKVFVMENVSGMVKGKMKGRFKEIVLKLKNTGYIVKCKQLNAMYYNVPQSRQRLFFIGVRSDLGKEPVFPIPSKKIIIVKEALKDNISIESEIKEAFDKTPNYIKPLLKKMKDYEVASKYDIKGNYFNHKRNGISRPSRTILKTPDTYHHRENRLLTETELKLLSSFPVDFKLLGTLTNKYNRIGNAVMPNQMKAIAEIIKEKILNGK